MRRNALLICTIALSLTVGGCANGKSVLLGGTDPFATITQPVSLSMLNSIEQALSASTAGLVAYRRACIRKAIDRSCRGVIEAIQPFTRAAATAIVNLRKFVRENDQVNAVATFNTLREIITQINAARAGASK